ncbi:hypothetical protein DX130_17235 [Paenibacillus paeoniae]|uniref:Uncharacterized protein n=1 Tax=Paenibacillus paeoniae TaxID=2292705 RepID=A0A371PED1_9BACL|nr:hypothetical protein DX130_17235 [Paenibacillus paeoniae]
MLHKRSVYRSRIGPALRNVRSSRPGTLLLTINLLHHARIRQKRTWRKYYNEKNDAHKRLVWTEKGTKKGSQIIG